MSSRKYFYPLDIDKIAKAVVKSGIDIAPTRQLWERLAQCIATNHGEAGRDAFHRMAAVWPDYSRHDSELCYNRALRRSGATVSMGWLVSALRKKGLVIDTAQYRLAGGRPLEFKEQPKKAMKEKEIKKIPFELLLRTLLNSRSAIGCNPLTDLLLKLYPQTKVLFAMHQYLIGFKSFQSGILGDAIIFWQIDEQRNIVNAKEIHYKFDGHRNKDIPPLVKFPENPQCLFGLHMLNDCPDKPIAIVESEKSALVLSMEMDAYLWMACGSLSNFNERFLKPLRGRKIVGFPDLDQKRDKKTGYSVSTAAWLKQAAVLRSKGYDVTIDLTLEEKATSLHHLKKCDLADLALEKLTINYKYKLIRKEI